MDKIVSLTDENNGLRILGVKFLGLDGQNGRKLLLTLGFILVALLFSFLLKWILKTVTGPRRSSRFEFWSRQGINLFSALLIVSSLASIWFDDPGRLTTFFGLITAGLAFALQKLVSAFAGYFIILRGKVFNVGDRITMGGVRGDVIALDFTKTTLMEMGQPPAVQSSEPAMWVKSRQFTGRVVTISNSKVFDEPVYNYTREFPFIWEEITIPITYKADRIKTEEILLSVARKHTDGIAALSEEALEKMKKIYFLQEAEMKPRVYYRITDNWLELSVRFIVRDHGIRELKDVMQRDILSAFDQAGIGIASATYDIVGFPSLRPEQTLKPEGS